MHSKRDYAIYVLATIKYGAFSKETLFIYISSFYYKNYFFNKDIFTWISENIPHYMGVALIS